MNRRTAMLAPWLLGLGLAGSRSGHAVQAGNTLAQVWTGLVGRKGALVEQRCKVEWTLAGPGQSGNAVVVAVEADHVVFQVSRDQKSFEMVVPFDLLVLQRPG